MAWGSWPRWPGGVIEYKGSHLETGDDTTQKQAIGQLWEARSKGLCVFRLATKKDMSEVIRGAVRGD
jgi:type III restriction enzyme